MRRAHGYTVIEVIMALAVLTLGSAGVIAMQKAALISNTQARNLATANTLAQGWMERMRVDSLSWTDTGSPGSPTNLPNTKWLNNVGTGWFSPSPTIATTAPFGTSPADIMGADILGADVGNVNPAFCSQARLTRFTQNPTTCATSAVTLGAGDTNLCTLYRMIRVEVRVYWDKSGRALDCTASLPSDYTLNRYGFVYLVSAILENNAPF
jgi:prepilin-type N-terminal cleavage/methylation domain-containing protein